MVSTKIVDKTILEIEDGLKSFDGDMVKIEYLENCLKQVLPNDVKRFCHLRIAEMYAKRTMFNLAAKNMNEAGECATNRKDKVNFYLKEISFLVKSGEYILIDNAFKKALSYVNEIEKELIKVHIKKELINQAQDFEKKNKRSNAAAVYEKLLSTSIITESERLQIIKKLGGLNSKLGRIADAIKYETMAKRSIEQKALGEDTKKISFEDFGLEEVR